MLVKIVVLFLIGMAVLAMFGRLRLPGRGKRAQKRPASCPRCGRYIIGKGPCDCTVGRG